MVYLNPYRHLLYNAEIIEWDIRAANISIIKEFSLLSDEIIAKIEKMPKRKRNIRIGLYARDNKDFSKALEAKFNDVVSMFMKLNGLDMEHDVISVKRDAVFVVNRAIKISTIGSNIEFIPKNVYSSYIYLKPYEFYIGNGITHVKGIDTSLCDLHNDGILSFIHDIISILSDHDSQKHNKLNEYMKDFVLSYKKKELEFDFYREFNSLSRYMYQIDSHIYSMDHIVEELLEGIDISYNYRTIILPLIRLVCQ